MIVNPRLRPTLRVVQWATGNIGTRSLRHLIEHPDLDLVGVFVHDPSKAGQDAGELAGLAPNGVFATDKLGDILALKPDCVIYMPRHPDLNVICALLAGGINVVTTTGVGAHAASMDPATREQIEAACRQGSASIHATGSSPGFITETLPLALMSIQRRLDRITIDEFADLSRRDSPGLLFDVMGFGKPPSEMLEGRADHLAASFGPSLRNLAETLGIRIDEITAHQELAVTPRRIEIAAGVLEAGTVACQRNVITASSGGRDVLVFRANWYCSTELDPAWDLGDTGWRVIVEGDAPLALDVRMPITLEQMAATTPGYTANGAVNSVAAVCAAPPGMVTIADLPRVLPVLV
jgi:2,4-diaminopentanoate dehydrogenase